MPSKGVAAATFSCDARKCLASTKCAAMNAMLLV
jgi:hypothetical protein